MKIAVATMDRESKAMIPETLAEAKYLFIVETDDFAVKEILPAVPPDQDIRFAEQTVERGCEAIICGEIDEQAFEILAGEGVTRYLGAGQNASGSLKLMQARQLPLIREYAGGPGPEAHQHGTCGGHHEEE